MMLCILRATALYAIARMLSPVRPSVCLSVTRVDQTKTVVDKIMKLAPHDSSFLTPNFITNGGLKEGKDVKIQRFSSFKREYLENGTSYY